MDDPRPGSSFLLEADLDPDLAQEGCCPPKPTGQCARVAWPVLGLGDALTGNLGQGIQKVRGRSRSTPCGLT